MFSKICQKKHKTSSATFHQIATVQIKMQPTPLHATYRETSCIPAPLLFRVQRSKSADPQPPSASLVYFITIFQIATIQQTAGPCNRSHFSFLNLTHLFASINWVICRLPLFSTTDDSSRIN